MQKKKKKFCSTFIFHILSACENVNIMMLNLVQYKQWKFPFTFIVWKLDIKKKKNIKETHVNWNESIMIFKLLVKVSQVSYIILK